MKRLAAGFLSLFLLAAASPPQDQRMREPRIVSLYIEPLPEGIDKKYLDAVRDAYIAWEKTNPHLAIREEGNKRKADVHVSWVKEFGGNKLGHTVHADFFEVGLGDSKCSGTFRQYTDATVKIITMHELGHVFGIPHSQDKNSIMYESIETKYDADIDETKVLADGWIKRYPFCTSRKRATYLIDIVSSEPLNIYVLPDAENYKKLLDGKEFSHDTNCAEKDTRNYRKTCAVQRGSILVVENPRSFLSFLDDNTAKYTIRVAEQ